MLCHVEGVLLQQLALGCQLTLRSNQGTNVTNSDPVWSHKVISSTLHSPLLPGLPKTTLFQLRPPSCTLRGYSSQVPSWMWGSEGAVKLLVLGDLTNKQSSLVHCLFCSTALIRSPIQACRSFRDLAFWGNNTFIVASLEWQAYHLHLPNLTKVCSSPLEKDNC